MVREAGGRALLVGGCVRDAALGLQAKDLDIEVFGIDPAQLHKLLRGRFPLDVVGQAFDVIKLQGLPIDVSLPCRRSTTGPDRKKLDRLCDPSMTFEDAAARRDFTMNAIALDPLTQDVLDPYGGLRDLEARTLRHTSDQFGEDPLRVLRAMQFASRFDLTVAQDTVALCRTLTPDGLPQERLFEEWRKLIVKGLRPSRGLSFLRDCGWVRYFPELVPLSGCRQEPDYHPEGDVWTHTLHCLDAFAGERSGDEWEDLVVGLAVLCHDFGKPATTKVEDGRIHSRGHETVSEVLTRAFLGRLTNQADLIEAVAPLVQAHLRPRALFEAQAGASAIRRLAREVGRIDRLVRVARYDHMGRPPQPFDGFPAGQWLIEKSRGLGVEREAPHPLVMGRHLLELGLEPGQRMGAILKACYDAQIDGAYATLEEGLAYAKGLISSPGGKRL
ncbi:MAG: CCA tRNA nucleotidyltransferase [Nitrospira sp.]|nr:CCA tRNA nucleotidyltransferase [Nitrospira sp.]